MALFEKGTIVTIIPAPPDLWLPAWNGTGSDTKVVHERVAYLALVDGHAQGVDLRGIHRDRWIEFRNSDDEALDNINGIAQGPCDAIEHPYWYCTGHDPDEAPDNAHVTEILSGS